MTSIIGTSGLAALVDSTKGSKGNRLECAANQYKNDLGTNIKSGAVLATGTGVTYVASKNKTVASALEKPIQKLISSAEWKKATNLCEPAIKFVKSAPTVVKIGTGLLLAGITVKNLIKRGQIDQKYSDRALAQKNLSQNI